MFGWDWSQFNIDGNDKNSYCTGWFERLIYAQVVINVSDFSEIFINTVLAIVMRYLSEFMKRHTTIEE